VCALLFLTINPSLDTRSDEAVDRLMRQIWPALGTISVAEGRAFYLNAVERGGWAIENPERKLTTGKFDPLLMARFAVEWIQRFETPLYAGVIAAFVLLFVAAAKLLTVEADEAWNLLSTMHAFGISLPPTDALVSPILTSGGVHFLIHGILAWITNSIFVHRLVSVLFAALLLATVYRALRQMNRPTPVALAGTALFAAIPGFIFQAGLATAEIIATWLLIFGCLCWVRTGRSSVSGALKSGVLFGLSCATRVNCVVVLPAIFIAAVLSGVVWRARTLRAILTVCVATLILAIAMAAYFLAARTSHGFEVGHFFLGATGLAASPKSPTHLLWAFVISDHIMPTWFIAVICGAYLVFAGESKQSAAEVDPTSLTGLLLLIGLVGLLAWIGKAPIPHVRYLWPAIPCLWFAGIIQLTQPAFTKQKGLPALALHILILAACGSRLMGDVLILAHGESLTLVYQANGISPFRMPRRSFTSANDQRSLAAFVAAQRDNARFYTLISPNAYPITLLSRRTISPIETMNSTGLRFLIVDPADFVVWHPDAAFVQWVRASTTPALVSGDFAAFRIRDDAGPPPPSRETWIGQDELLDF
jgi:hypothetical protein